MYLLNQIEAGDVTETPDELMEGRITMGEVEAPINENLSSIRKITIEPLSSGYMVKVGCQSVAVEKTETLITMLSKYLDNPIEFQKKWYSNDVRNRLENIV